MRAVLLSLICCLSIAAQVKAEHCYPYASSLKPQAYSSYSYGYDLLNVGKRSFVVTPYAYSVGVPVAVPSYVEYNPAYSLPAIQQPYKSGGKNYSQFAEEYREYLELLAQYKALKAHEYERYLTLKARFAGDGRGSRDQGQGPDKLPDVPPSLDPKPPQANRPSTLDQQVTQIFATHCAACHGPAEQKHGFQLIGSGGGLTEGLSKPIRALVYRQVLKGQMPPGAPLDQELVDVIDAWADEAD